MVQSASSSPDLCHRARREKKWKVGDEGRPKLKESGGFNFFFRLKPEMGESHLHLSLAFETGVG
jgi:hypothetical protein